ncbi:MAG: rhomboid family intramembrane serine protease [Firmicutes bacterium]|nr:rhomboid family intramembrane serine protease [Bacillota bacterium]
MNKFRISFNSPVVLTFAIICFVSLVMNVFTAGASNIAFFSIYKTSWSDIMMYPRLILHVFGHADWSHFFGNIMLILILGPLLEEKYGSADIIAVIVTTALATGLFNVLIFPNVRLLGASGVVFAFILLSSVTRLTDGTIPLTFILVAVIYIGGEIVNGVMLNDNVSNITHIIGGMVGAVMGFKFGSQKIKRK